MLCQHCQKRPANVHLTQIVNNKKSEVYLCEQCAAEKSKAGMDISMNIGDFFTGLMGLDHPASYTKKIYAETKRCEKCGMSLEDFQSLGKLGCDNCYKVFADYLRPLIKKIHGNTAHSGKVPARASEEIKTTEEIGILRQQLQDAINKEEYEKAAELRDRIKVFETGK